MLAERVQFYTIWTLTCGFLSSKKADHLIDHHCCCHSDAESELVLLHRLLHPDAQPGSVEGPEERLLCRVILHHRLLGLMVAPGSHGPDPQLGGELRYNGDKVHLEDSNETRNREGCFNQVTHR